MYILIFKINPPTSLNLDINVKLEENFEISLAFDLEGCASFSLLSYRIKRNPKDYTNPTEMPSRSLELSGADDYAQAQIYNS